MDFLVPAWLLLIAGSFAYWKFFFRYEHYLRRLCRGFSRGRYSRVFPNETDAGAGKRTYVFEATYQSRGFRVEYRYRPALEVLQKPWSDGRVVLSWKLNDELEMQFPVIQKFWLRILPKRIEAGPDEEVQIGDPEFDATYLIHSNQPEAAREFLKSRFVLEKLIRFPSYFERFEIHRGWLKLLIHEPVKHEFRRSGMESALEALSFLALDYVQRSVQFKLSAGSSTGYCPFCRDDLQDTGEPVVQCSICETRLHEACWKENGQCTTWGCVSVEAGR